MMIEQDNIESNYNKSPMNEKVNTSSGGDILTEEKEDNKSQRPARIKFSTKASLFLKQKFHKTRNFFKNSSQNNTTTIVNVNVDFKENKLNKHQQQDQSSVLSVSSASIDSITNCLNKINCKICLNNFNCNNNNNNKINDNSNQIFELSSCKCKFCKSCLYEYIKQSIENYNVLPINCPDLNCKSNGYFNSDEIKYIVLDSYISCNKNSSCSNSSSSSNSSCCSSITNNNNNKSNLLIKEIEYDSNNNYIYIHKPENYNDDKICFIDNEFNEKEHIETTYNAFLDHENSKRLVLYKKYLNICENIEILRDPNKTHCPKPSCQNVCKVFSMVDKNLNSSQNVKVICDKCNLEFCSKCFKNWTQLEAVNNDNNNNIKAINLNDVCICNLKRSNEIDIDENIRLISSDSCITNFDNIKRCPKCSILIERADGCAQVSCKVCRHMFCFHCLTSLEDDFLLKHYTKNGPCKGKLGHSRFTLLMHRIFVISLFSGTILLLIILSPFILLSLPCILFNSKFRKQYFKIRSKFG